MLFRFDERIIPMTKEEEMQFYLNDVKVFQKDKKGVIPEDQKEVKYELNFLRLINLEKGIYTSIIGMTFSMKITLLK